MVINEKGAYITPFFLTWPGIMPPVGDSLLLFTFFLPSTLSLSPFSFSLLLPDPHTPTVAVDLIPCGASPRRPSRFIPRFDRHSTCLIRSLLFLFLF
ncbi:uncharacterized protein BO87DRAFT_36480 [Aspergillus neoniger CBS 115656]|uniref:Uncharacterized protein n=1 Tax=Aspergillus neoniger (strain CBS 115656) TaxID=1448310 RepID=A0A318YML8_ASPNB|nr:hypothetical protein BO87DRAFT_36480 [Aspergillus neoniger CBS 115656]PYH35057.1 hypothetical protein BO87DRAFT_36480 [Aspergillus neoniger CBS 115656]